MYIEVIYFVWNLNFCFFNDLFIKINDPSINPPIAIVPVSKLVEIGIFSVYGFL